jgi:hypothetical protein
MSNKDIKNHLQETFTEYLDTLKNTSHDDKNDVYLCTDETLEPVYNFDEYIKINNNSPLPASPDAIYLGTKFFYFIEFKNSPLSNIKKKKIKDKFNSGTNILKDILLDYLPQYNFQFIFCVVYKPAESRYFNPTPIESNIIRFGLDEENKNNDNFYNKIITEDLNFYMNNFSMLRCL